MTVLHFPDRREVTKVGDLATCACGSTWFELYTVEAGERVPGRVVMNAEGSVTGYMGIPHCAVCGRENLP